MVSGHDDASSAHNVTMGRAPLHPEAVANGKALGVGISVRILQGGSVNAESLLVVLKDWNITFISTPRLAMSTTSLVWPM